MIKITCEENQRDNCPKLTPGKTRILDSDGFVATVLYVGTVASAKNSSEVYVGGECAYLSFVPCFRELTNTN